MNLKICKDVKSYIFDDENLWDSIKKNSLTRIVSLNFYMYTTSYAKILNGMKSILVASSIPNINYSKQINK